MNAKREQKSLAECFSEHRGKVSDKWSSYLEIYQRAFEPYRDVPVRLLEIGIQNGGSLEIWAKYFSNATAIVGCDINPACSLLHYADEKIHVVVDDANTEKAELSIAAFAPCFDIIIDDGSHRSSDIVLSFNRYFPRLELGGVFIAEDLHCSYWREFEGGLVDPWSSISFFKRLADVVNHEHWGIPQSRSEVLRSFEHRYGVNLSDSVLSEIHSVEFLNSVCVVTKKPCEANTLGKRVVSGADAHVDAGQFLKLRGTESIAPEQSSNEWSLLPPLPEDELQLLRAKNSELTRDVQESKHREEELNKAEEILRSLMRDRETELQALQESSRLAQLQHKQCLDRMSEDLKMERERGENLSAKLNAQTAQAEELTDTVRQLKERIQALLDSNSWRLTAPLRWIGLRFGGVFRRSN